MHFNRILSIIQMNEFYEIGHRGNEIVERIVRTEHKGFIHTTTAQIKLVDLVS